MSIKVKVVIEQQKDGDYVAFCPELRGCMSQGETLEEVKDNIKEAATGWLEAKVQLQLHTLLKRNLESKIPRNGHRIEKLTIPAMKLSLAGA